jgi:hypothetical protein
VDIRPHLYSLGVMVTLQTPFRGTAAEVMYQHQHSPLPLEQLGDFPQPVVVLLEKLFRATGSEHSKCRKIQRSVSALRTTCSRRTSRLSRSPESRRLITQARATLFTWLRDTNGFPIADYFVDQSLALRYESRTCCPVISRRKRNKLHRMQMHTRLLLYL